MDITILKEYNTFKNSEYKTNPYLFKEFRIEEASQLLFEDITFRIIVKKNGIQFWIYKNDNVDMVKHGVMIPHTAHNILLSKRFTKNFCERVLDTQNLPILLFGLLTRYCAYFPHTEELLQLKELFKQ